MSSLNRALEKLDAALGQLDESVVGVMSQRMTFERSQENADFIAHRLDMAIQKVEQILMQEGA